MATLAEHLEQFDIHRTTRGSGETGVSVRGDLRVYLSGEKVVVQDARNLAVHREMPVEEFPEYMAKWLAQARRVHEATSDG